MSGPRLAVAAAIAATALAACGAQAKRAVREFDGPRAFQYLQRQVEYGPRIPGTPAHEQAGDWIATQLRATADTVVVQEIPHQTPTGPLRLRNFLARFRPDAAERILFLAHWDTRPKADQSANLAAQRMPVPGANDGASGVAILLGVAEALKARPPVVGVDLLFDGGDHCD
jgi:acetylornithine deacetylase/succinyl-diaminopimelate desuccinylase-like protein